MPLSALSPNARGALIALGSFAVFSAHDVVVKYLGGAYSPIQIIFFSVLFSFPLFVFVLLGRAAGDGLRPRRPWWTLARTLAVVVTAFSAFTAFSLLPLAQTYAILFATPLLITVLAVPLLGERVGLRRGIAVVVGLCGVLVVLRPASVSLSLGHLAALVAAIGSACASIIVRRLGSTERSAVLLVFPLLANVLVMGALLPVVYVPMPLEHLGAVAGLSVLSLLATAGMIAAYRAGEAGSVAPMQYSQILWAALYGWLLFDERLDAATIAGASIVIASGLYILLRESSGTASRNRPVLSTRTRMETGIAPRISALTRRQEDATSDHPPRSQ